MPLQPGDLIGNYRVIELVGSGGMGHVYKVQNTLSHRVEAMKVLLPELSSNPELAGRFMREIQVQAALAHPNIATLHTALQIGDQMVMLMEYVDGETLESRLRRGAMPVDECIGVSMQVLSALSYAHKQGVIHRDVKPANIILGTSGVTKMMDFGLAAVGMPEGEDRRLTRTGTVMGSLSYMSPEQVRGQAPTARSDIYSFGLTLYEMLTGVRGVTGDSDYAVMTAHLDVMPPAPAAVNSSVPPALSDIVLRAIAKHPASRFSSADELSAALAGYRNEPPRVTIEKIEAPQPPVADTRPRERWLGVWIAAIAAIILATAAAIYWRSGSSLPAKPAPSAIEVAEAPAAKAPPVVSTPPPVVRPSQPVQQKAAASPSVGKSAVGKSAISTPVVSTPAANTPEPAKPAQVATNPVAPAATSEPAPVKPVPTSPVAPAPSPTAVSTPVTTPAASAAAPSPAATPTVTNPPVIPTPPAVPVAEITRALERLQAAYASRDMNQVRAVFPGITADHARQLEKFFNSARSAALRLEPVGQPRPGPDRVTVEVRHWLTAKFKDGTEQRPAESRALIRLVRGRAGWVIDAMDFTQRGRSLFPPL